VVRSTLSRYLVAVAATIAAIAFRFVLNPLLGEGTVAYFTLWPTVVFVALYAGLGPALLAIALGCLGADLFLLPPLFELRVHTDSDFAGLWTFALFGTAAAIVAQVGYQARLRAEQSALEARQAADVLRKSQAQADRQAAQMRLIPGLRRVVRPPPRGRAWQTHARGDRTRRPRTREALHDRGAERQAGAVRSGAAL
jgi:K+-sensing histidine kinase KdpD